MSLRGNLSVVSETGLDQVHEATLKILRDVGVRITNSYVRQVCADAGFSFRGEDVVVFSGRQVDEAIAATPKQYRRLGREPRFDFDMGGGAFSVGSGSLPLYVLDATTGKRRDAVKRDMLRFSRLGDACPNLAIGNGMVKPHDVPDSVVHAIWDQNATKNIAKPTCCWYATDRQMAQDTIDILTAAAGGPGELERCNTWAITVCPEQALTWADSAVGIVEMARASVPIEIMPMHFPGSMHPVTLAGTLVQENAEFLSGLILAQTIRPGVPVNYSPYGGIMDMAAATHAFGAPEGALFAAAVAQLCRRYGIPSNLVVGISDSKVPDAQAAYEKSLALLLIALAGADASSLIGGELESGLTASYEQLVIDDEIAGQVQRIIRGFEVGPETLATDVIARVGPGGNYLGDEHTLRHYREELSFWPLTDRASRQMWERAGGKDVVTRASERVEQLLAQPGPEPLAAGRADDVDRVVREICRREGVSYERVAV